MKYINLVFSIIWIYLCYLMVSLNIPYQLCHLEHTNLFIGDSDCFLQSLEQLGGLGNWIASFGIQFFAIWGIGSCIFIIPVLCLFVTLAYLLPINGAYRFSISACIATLQLLSMFDCHYGWSGTVSLSIALLLLLFISLIKSNHLKMIGFLLGIPFVLWCFGSVSFVFTVTGMCLFFNTINRKYSLLLPIGVLSLFNLLIYQQGLITSYKEIVSPLFYYDLINNFPLYHWLPWGALLFVFVVSRILTFRLILGKLLLKVIHSCLWILLCILFIVYAPLFSHAPMQVIYRLNHYSYTENWDSILRLLSGSNMDNWLYMNYVNLALAQKGELGNMAFLYKPQGRAALLVNSSPDGLVRILQSDINYAVGCIAESQHQAFDAQIAFHKNLGIQTLKRLVQTNLIFGHYAVADKYLQLIEKTTLYKDWARKYRLYLYNDVAVMGDVELGEKRKSLVHSNRFALINGWTSELEDIVSINPHNKKAFEYLGIAYLLGKDMESFRILVEKYYGTESLLQLPTAFQQAILVLYNNQENKWSEYGILPEIIDDYKRFLALNEKNINNPNREKILESAFGHTFWYYSLFI